MIQNLTQFLNGIPFFSSVWFGVIAMVIVGGSFPPELYQSRKRVVGSGNCVRFCRSIQREIELQFQLLLEIRSIREEAAVGAAKLAVQSASRD